MKRWLYESAAWIMALCGALIFGFGMCPVLNPIQFKLNYGPAYLPAMIFSIPASIVIMWIAWRLSREAQRFKEEEKKNGEREKDTAAPGEGPEPPS